MAWKIEDCCWFLDSFRPALPSSFKKRLIRFSKHHICFPALKSCRALGAMSQRLTKEKFSRWIIPPRFLWLDALAPLAAPAATFLLFLSQPAASRKECHR